MRELRLTWKPPGSSLPDGESDNTRRVLFGLHLVGSLMVLLAAWPPGWRLGEPVLSSPFRTWWGVEVTFLGLLALQFGARRWRAGSEGAYGQGGARPDDDLLWLLLMVASVVPVGLAAYQVGSVPPAHPASLVASLGAELFFFMVAGRAMRGAMPEPALGLTVWAFFLLLALGPWLPGLRTWGPLPGGSPLPSLGPIPYPVALDQPAVAAGSWHLPFPLLTSAGWSLTALGLWSLGRLRSNRGRGS